jgi:hypothetical protein
MTEPDPPDFLPGAIRIALFAALLVLCAVGAMYKPLWVMGLGVGLAVILVVSKMLGDLIWGDDARPDGGRPKAPRED